MKTKSIIGFLLTIAIAVSILKAEDFDRSKLPKLLGASNAGTEFYFTFIPCWETPDAGNDLKIYISSSVATDVTLSVLGKNFSQTKQTIPNDIIEFTLPPAIGQAYRKTHLEMPLKEQVFKDAGIHIKSGAPIVCYGVTRFMYTSDGFLAIPVSSLGNEYVVASYADPSPNTGQFISSYTGITAAYDDTRVTFTMCGTDFSKTAGGLNPGESSEFILNKGDVLLVAGLGAYADLSGSRINATSPVSVVSGNFCSYVPTNCGCCDVLIEQEIPTFSWGTEYHVTRVINRLKNSMIKVFAKENSTKIYRDNLQIGYIQNVMETEGKGHLHLRADGGSPRPIIISGDKQIGVTQYNTGQMDDNIVSDPFQMVLYPIEQYHKEITFNTPGIRGRVGFPYNYLNICYESDESGRIPDDFMYSKVKNGEFQWSSLKEEFPEIGQPFTHKDGSRYYFSKTLTLPSDGVYKLKCNTPFAAYAYGFSWFDSYGFPAAGSYIEEFRDPVPPVPIITENNDGNVRGTITAIRADDLLVNLKGPDLSSISTLSMIFLYEPESYNYTLTHSDFTPGKNYNANWEINVIDKSKDARAVLIFADRSGNDTVLVFTYKPVSVEENNFDIDLVLYPQPVINELSVVYTKHRSGMVSISLIDINGNLIKELVKENYMSAGQSNLNFELSDIANGMYNVQIKDDTSIMTRKVVIQR